ncbi:retropepsin-like aspartic protease [Tenacibaculum sp. M341]|uniref:retropepsin-like aspartic protease n=1 Tax=Tenacibaculum sp. M341 TaxID=2530339 RepID=UPI001049CF31|nr:retropepsin-like aspartic protease [Tenacibaculum sp. M341]TCI90618.1 acid protease [Tenacibaculum sp. M341]
MEKEITGHLVLMTNINGIKSRLILDTGATNTAIDIKKQQELKLNSELSNEVATGAGKTDIPFEKAQDVKLEINGLTFNKKELYIMNLDYVNSALSDYGIDKIDGILGADILTEFNAIIDYTNLTIYMKKSVD